MNMSMVEPITLPCPMLVPAVGISAQEQPLFTGKRKGAFAGVRNRVLLSQQQERMTQIAEMIGSTIERLSDDLIAVNELIEIAKQVTFILGAMNDILDRSRSGEISTVDFDEENLDFFLNNAAMIASIIESALHIQTEMSLKGAQHE